MCSPATAIVNIIRKKERGNAGTIGLRLSSAMSTSESGAGPVGAGEACVGQAAPRGHAAAAARQADKLTAAPHPPLVDMQLLLPGGSTNAAK